MHRLALEKRLHSAQSSRYILFGGFHLNLLIIFLFDAFGSGNLLLTTNFSTLLATTTRIESYMKRHGIEKMYPGHYMGSNPETLQRISDLNKMSEEMVEGKREGNMLDQAMLGLNARIRDFGVNISYRYPDGVK